MGQFAEFQFTLSAIQELYNANTRDQTLFKSSNASKVDLKKETLKEIAKEHSGENDVTKFLKYSRAINFSWKQKAMLYFHSKCSCFSKRLNKKDIKVWKLFKEG